MRVLVIGSGAREHALCWALRRSPRLSALYCAPGNGGVASLAECVALNPLEIAACAEWAAHNAIDLTIVGPEDPLANGIVDAFQARGLAIFGPTAAAARIESSKAWAKQLMMQAGVPTARAERFSDHAAALTYLEQREQAALATHKDCYPVVIKADGLVAGKGVVIAHDGQTARAALNNFLVEQTLGAAGATILIEDFLQGVELSLFTLADGEHVLPMAPACDYKRVYDGDQGPNTGGMGAYSPPSFATPALLEEIEQRILRPTVAALAQAGAPFRGLLYAGLMITESGPYVLEYNARFGDPETQVVLPRLRSDLLEVCDAVAHGRLGDAPQIEWSNDVTCGVVLASAGYPGHYEKGLPITGLDTLDDGVLAFHAGTRLEADGRLVTSGGRVLTVVASGATMAEARTRAYANVERIHFEGAHWRADIAAREIV